MEESKVLGSTEAPSFSLGEACLPIGRDKRKRPERGSRGELDELSPLSPLRGT